MIMPDGKLAWSGGWDGRIANKQSVRTAPVVQKPAAESARFDCQLAYGDRDRLFMAAYCGLRLGLGPQQLLPILGLPVRLRFAIMRWTCMLGLGYVSAIPAWTAVLGSRFSRTGWFSLIRHVHRRARSGAAGMQPYVFSVVWRACRKITRQQLILSPESDVPPRTKQPAGQCMGKRILTMRAVSIRDTRGRLRGQ